jgi:hypothetical protein
LLIDFVVVLVTCSTPLGSKKLLIFSVNGVLCYFPPSAVLQGIARLFGRKVDKAKVEVRMEWKIFLQRHLKKNYVAIWSCMKLEDVLELLSLFMPKNFVDRFVFIWGHEQCSKIAGQISLGSHYYLKDLKRVYYGCCGLSYGKEDQTLLIDDEPSKHYGILNGVVFFLNHSRDKCC